MYASPQLVDRWEILYRACTVQPLQQMDHDCAGFVLAGHAGHGSGCKPYLAALAHVSVDVPGGVS